MLKTFSFSISVFILSIAFYIALKPLPEKPMAIDSSPKTLNITFLELQKQGYIEKQASFTFIPEKTAFVMIDLWDKDFLSGYVQQRINPTIQLMRSRGVLIIHARSQKPLSDLVDRHEIDIEVKDYDNMDEVLAKHNIDTLIYAGFNTMYCVIDKPNGILNIKSRQPDLNFFMVPELLASRNKLVKNMAIDLLKRQNVKVVTLKELYRGFGAASLVNYEPLIFSRKLKNKKPQKPYPMAINSTVALAFDDVLLNKNQHAEVIQTASDYQQKGLVVFRYSGGLIWYNNKKISTGEFFQYLQDHNIHDILFFGGHLNDKMIAGNVGISRFYMNSRYLGKKSPNIWLVKDKLYVLNPQKKELSAWLNYYRKPNKYNGLKGRPTIGHQDLLKLLQ